MRKLIVPLVAAVGLSACSTSPQMGAASNYATGSAAGASSNNANKQLAHCNKTLGTLAIHEDTDAPWYFYAFQNYHLQSTVPVLRMMVQQSNCFVIVERGAAMSNVMGERALSESGETRAGSNMGKGQMVTADYTMSPTINFNQQGGSGVAAGIGGLIGGGLVGGLVGSVSSNDASTTLLLIDNRSSVQISASEGSAKNWDIGGMGGLFGGFAGGGAGGYSSTPEGKVITAAFMDSYNQMVEGLRNYQAQQVEGGLGTGGALGVSGGTTSASKKLGPQ